MKRHIMICCLAVAVACRDGQAAAEPRGNGVTVVDSILDTEEAMARFVSGLDRVDSLTSGAPTLDLLVASFADAVSRADSTSLRRMLVSRSEYGYLYYPSSTYARAPYQLAPDVAWLLSSQGNDKAINRLVRRLGGSPLAVQTARCEKIEKQGDNSVHSRCSVTAPDADGMSRERQLFQSVLEHKGRFKFLSYSGDY